MSKEQLEDIKNNKTYLEGTNELIIAINTDDYDWLIEQAERVQEYDKELISLEDNKHYVSEILAKNKRYREALEFYADGENYDEEMIGSTLISGSKVMYDEGQIAREVLEERSNR